MTTRTSHLDQLGWAVALAAAADHGYWHGHEDGVVEGYARANEEHEAARPHRYVSAHDLLERVQRIASAARAADLLYDVFDGLLSDGHFDKCDNILNAAEPEELGVNLTVAMLTVSYVARDRLMAREQFVERAVKYVRQCESARADKILQGLV